MAHWFCPRLAWLLIVSVSAETEWPVTHKYIFPTLVLVPNNDTVSSATARAVKQLKGSVLHLADTNPGQRKSNFGGWHSAGENLLDTPEKKLKGITKARKVIENAIETHLRSLKENAASVDGGSFLGGRATVTFGNSWANVNGWSDWNVPHQHEGSDLSGVFFVQCPGGHCHLSLVDPRSGKNSAVDNIVLSLQEGSAVVFPGWLTHFVAARPEPIADKRITLSFNVKVDYTIGPPPLHLAFRNSRGVDELKEPQKEDKRWSMHQLWSTVLTSIRPPNSGNGDRETLQELSSLVGAYEPGRKGESPNLLYSDSLSGLPLSDARQRVEHALREHVEREANRTGVGGRAYITVIASWAHAHAAADLLNTHNKFGGDLVGFLCLTPGRYQLLFNDPRLQSSGDSAALSFHTGFGKQLTYDLDDCSGTVMVLPKHMQYMVLSPGASTISFGARLHIEPGSPPLQITFEEPQLTCARGTSVEKCERTTA
eukprot:TRINITY_DN33010_c0_g1_i1.p1 TRINITY_DN33010_c0_g1~~TRINITY_DN33010_c0_g1_i1.p1  ORF type:complete len:484 (+),score=36.82 TRINITY_DN33010_c0_g1_i1:45-1496(+)